MLSYQPIDATIGAVQPMAILKKAIPFFVLVEFVTRQYEHPLQIVTRLPKVLRWVVYGGILWGTMYYMAQQQADFVYFQF